MTPEQVPERLIRILDDRAGRTHSRTGSVVSCLAEILTEDRRMTRTLLRFWVAMTIGSFFLGVAAGAVLR